MLNNTVTVNYKSTAHTLSRNDGPSGYTGRFFKRTPLLDLTLQIGHAIPAASNATEKGESHVVTLWATEFDVDGNVIGKNRAYTRVESVVSKQDSTDIVDLEAALRDFMATNVAAVVDRAS